jgi:predicted DCC family thiol-disulfide oxidoreductase YuxK
LIGVHRSLMENLLMNKPGSLNEHKRIILFDGVCNLCSGFLAFVYKRDKKRIFKFAWIQDEKGMEILNWLHLPSTQSDTIVLIEAGQSSTKSSAFLKIVSHLKFPWPLLAIGYLIPMVIRDGIYDWVAKNRYRWFGRKKSCIVPTGDLRERFLSTN